MNTGDEGAPPLGTNDPEELEADGPPVYRDKGGRFLPGSIANPGGRPKKVSIMTHVRKILEEKDPEGRSGFERLAEVMLEQANNGDFKFLKEVIDRFDGPIVKEVKTESINTNVADMLRLAAQQNKDLGPPTIDAKRVEMDPLPKSKKGGGLIGMKKKKKKGSAS